MGFRPCSDGVDSAAICLPSAAVELGESAVNWTENRQWISLHTVIALDRCGDGFGAGDLQPVQRGNWLGEG